jgi:hypothetical protein
VNADRQKTGTLIAKIPVIQWYYTPTIDMLKTQHLVITVVNFNKGNEEAKQNRVAIHRWLS